MPGARQPSTSADPVGAGARAWLRPADGTCAVATTVSEAVRPPSRSLPSSSSSASPGMQPSLPPWPRERPVRCRWRATRPARPQAGRAGGWPRSTRVRKAEPALGLTLRGSKTRCRCSGRSRPSRARPAPPDCARSARSRADPRGVLADQGPPQHRRPHVRRHRRRVEWKTQGGRGRTQQRCSPGLGADLEEDRRHDQPLRQAAWTAGVDARSGDEGTWKRYVAALPSDLRPEGDSLSDEAQRAVLAVRAGIVLRVVAGGDDRPRHLQLPRTQDEARGCCRSGHHQRGRRRRLEEHPRPDLGGAPRRASSEYTNGRSIT